MACLGHSLNVSTPFVNRSARSPQCHTWFRHRGLLMRNTIKCKVAGIAANNSNRKEKNNSNKKTKPRKTEFCKCGDSPHLFDTASYNPSLLFPLCQQHDWLGHREPRGAGELPEVLGVSASPMWSTQPAFVLGANRGCPVTRGSFLLLVSQKRKATRSCNPAAQPSPQSSVHLPDFSVLPWGDMGIDSAGSPALVC